MAMVQGAQTVNVNVGFNSQMPLQGLDEETMTQMQRAARERLYLMSSQECALLKATIAESCRLTSLSVNTQIQRHNPDQPLLYVNGNASFQITLKGDLASGGEAQ